MPVGRGGRVNSVGMEEQKTYCTQFCSYQETKMAPDPSNLREKVTPKAIFVFACSK